MGHGARAVAVAPDGGNGPAAVPSPGIARLRNIGVIAHIDAGKTTLTDRILFHTGRIHRLGSVDGGTTVTDWMDQERERGITIVAAAISTVWREHAINLIDTPGHIDFTAEVQRSLRVLDGAVVAFDGVAGVQPQSETVWRQADRYRVPRLCFINKLDRVGADFGRAVDSIRRRLGAALAVLQLPLGTEREFSGVIDLLSMRTVERRDPAAPLVVGEVPASLRETAEVARGALVEVICEADETLLASYVAGRSPNEEELRAALRRATVAGRLFPVCCGAALRDIGIEPLLDGIVDFLPSPLDRGGTPATSAAAVPIVATTAATYGSGGGPAMVAPEPRAAPVALAFKQVNDPYVGHLTYLRVYSGTLQPGMSLLNPRTGKSERLGRLLRMYANHRDEVPALAAGDIGAVLGLHGVATGDTLCSPEAPVQLEAIGFPEPVIRASVEPRVGTDPEQLVGALRRLADEDPTLHLESDDESGRLVVAGMGELHLEVLFERLRREFGLAVLSGRPQVAYRETAGRAVKGIEGRCIKQTGGHGLYGHVVIELEPGAGGSGVRFVSALSGGSVPRQFVPAIEQGVRDAAAAGPLAGYAVTDVLVRLIGGSTHPVDASELAFRTAASSAVKSALQQAAPRLLEPIFRFEVLLPGEYVGSVVGQLAQRRAAISGVEARPGEVSAIVGRVPLAEMFGYVTELRSATQGRGQLAMEFDGYEAVPAENAAALIGGGGHGRPGRH